MSFPIWKQLVYVYLSYLHVCPSVYILHICTRAHKMYNKVSLHLGLKGCQTTRKIFDSHKIYHIACFSSGGPKQDWGVAHFGGYAINQTLAYISYVPPSLFNHRGRSYDYHHWEQRISDQHVSLGYVQSIL